MNAVRQFVSRHRVLTGVAALLASLVLLVVFFMLYAKGHVGATLLSDVPTNEEKLRAAALPTVAPGPNGPGQAPTFLLLGSPHLAQEESPPNRNELNRITGALTEFRPDMLVVEQLPPDWPVGKGRDYRPEFKLERYAEDWGLSQSQLPAIIDSLGPRTNLSPSERCRLGRAYFLTRDLANALYQWTGADCPVADDTTRLADWFDRNREHEMARIEFEVARDNDVQAVVPFDYQGEDAEWFLFDDLQTALKQWNLRVLPDLGPVVQIRHILQSYASPSESLTERLRSLNSPAWLALQYWAYEQKMPTISYQDAGQRQTDNYWLRNRKMFARIEDAIDTHHPDRVLIVVGSGHKYFLDTLIRNRRYRWVDPREYLPAP